jgi:translation elongation factor EF-Tu-like GTPase
MSAAAKGVPSGRLYPCDDFEATIRVYSAAEGGRCSPVSNGIRWDFAYAADEAPQKLYMIWPDFFGADGKSLSSDLRLPLGVQLDARMFVVVDEMRAEVHRSRIVPGVRFYCQEGPRAVAEGVVTRVTGLFLPR